MEEWRRKHREQLYVFAVPGAMKNSHTFTDDVAITWAKSKTEAVERFSKLYANVTAGDVEPVRFGGLGGNVAILTDY